MASQVSPNTSGKIRKATACPEDSLKLSMPRQAPASGPLAPAVLLLPRPVPVGREVVGREHEALGRDDDGRVLSLGLQHLLEERVLRGLLRRDLVPGLEEGVQDVVRR